MVVWQVRLSSRGIRSICAFLEEHCVRVDEMIFNHNEVDDEGLYLRSQKAKRLVFVKFLPRMYCLCFVHRLFKSLGIGLLNTLLRSPLQ